MMRAVASAFSIVALVPAAVSAAVPVRTGAISVLLCTGDGALREIAIPVAPDAPTPAGETPCCAKGCHTGSSRKRGACA